MSQPRRSFLSCRPGAPAAIQGTSSSTGQSRKYRWPYLSGWQGTKRQRCAKEDYHSPSPPERRVEDEEGEGGVRVKGAPPYLSNAAVLHGRLLAELGRCDSGEEMGWLVVGTEGWAGKTSVILSSMLSHHRTNGLWHFYSPKTRDGKRCRYRLIYYCSFVPLFFFFLNKAPSVAIMLHLVKIRGERTGNVFWLRARLQIWWF